MSETERVIFLTRGFECRVDAVDYRRFGHLPWFFNGDNSPYAARHKRVRGTNVKVYLHRAIMNAPPGVIVNHKDGDTMNCTRCNLELASPRENATVHKVRRGKLGLFGVNFNDKHAGECGHRKNVQARITINGARVYLGAFYTVDEAITAYDTAAVAAYGELACTNNPITDYLSTWTAPALPEPEPDSLLRDIPF